jgi:hypothetical protein
MCPELTTTRNSFAREGRLEWIGLRPGHRKPIQAVKQVDVVAGQGVMATTHVHVLAVNDRSR